MSNFGEARRVLELAPRYIILQHVSRRRIIEKPVLFPFSFICLLVIVIIMSLINSKRGRLLKESAEENTSKSVVRREVIAQVLIEAHIELPASVQNGSTNHNNHYWIIFHSQIQQYSSCAVTQCSVEKNW